MFTVTEVRTPKGTLQYREEHFTGCRCRISPDRSKRHLPQPLYLPPTAGECPFCRDRVFSITPVFPDGKRVLCGESITFPNMFPFGEGHIVTVLTEKHMVETFSRNQISDGLKGQTEALSRYEGYPTINMNYLPSSGASILHPHMQGLSDIRPSRILERYLDAGRKYHDRHGGNYWDAVRDDDRKSGRFMFGDEIFWSAHAVPSGEREVRGILPISSLDELIPYRDLLAEGILEVISFYRRLGTYAFNISIFFDKGGCDRTFRAFCSIISRINPNPSSMSDSAFMERLHFEPVILTLPEEMGPLYRNRNQICDRE